MQQGSTIAPRALSTRCVSGVWLVFPARIYSLYNSVITELYIKK